MKRFSLILLVLLMSFGLEAQELSCQVNINTEQIQGTANKQIFDQMQKSIFEFMNNTKWTNDNFGPQERIECSILIIIKTASGTDDYQGSIQVTARRPVYKSGYYSQILNIEDDEFSFKYQQFTQLEFNINTFQNNITSVLAYYAYVVLATDYDSFSPLGGTVYWKKAQEVVNQAQITRENAWSSNASGQKNRYWVIENTLQPTYKGIRDCMYAYCMNGLDIMYQKPEDGRAEVYKALELLKPVAQSRVGSYVMMVFFNAKRDEIINIFKSATPEEKTKVMELLAILDPTGTTRYQKIQG